MAAADLQGPLRRDRALRHLCRTGAETEVSDVLERPRVAVEPSTVPGAEDILTPDALDFLIELHERFDGRRRALLAARGDRQERFKAGELPDFPDSTADLRAGEWRVGEIP